MRKLLHALLTLLIGCGLYGPSTYGFVPYVPEGYGDWVSKLEEYYLRPLPSLYSVSWYYGVSERVHYECDNDQAGACVFQDGTILMTDRHRESCLMGLHELMHPAMREVYGDSDHDHLRGDWGDISGMCREIQQED